MTDTRPDPDKLLAQVARQQAATRRGKLKVFFGSNAGVGKTYAMLDEARKRAAEGANVLIGYAEPHIRPETESLLLGLDILPYKLVHYKDSTLKEFDLDAALAKKPTLLCVDELAHTNAPAPEASRHPKRWQDVDELLNAGINVYTTLNVQHLESVNDIVERITGIKVRETLPDRVFEEADEVELVDIAPDELIERLREGKVYKPQQVEYALKNFFNRGNLIALRELALRKTAERVDAQMQDARRDAAITGAWAASERILVCLSSSPFSPQLVRAARRLAIAFRAPWIAAHVETSTTASQSQSSLARLNETLQLAEQLGAQTRTLSGENVADELLSFARQKNITKIVIGKPEQPRWREWIFGSIVDDLIRKSGQIDIHVIRDQRPQPPASKSRRSSAPANPRPYLWAAGICLFATALGMVIFHLLHLSNNNALMIQLLAVLFVAARFGRGPAVVASFLSVAAFDFTVVEPYYTFSVDDTQYFFTFAVMLVTALLISTLADRIRRQAISARNRERRTAALLSLSRDLAAMREKDDILHTVAAHVAEVFDSPAALFLSDAAHGCVLAAASGQVRGGDPLTEKELSVVQWVCDHNQPAGRGTATLPAAAGLYLPLTATRGPIGVLGLLNSQPPADPERFHLLEAFANQSALALERAILADESRQAWERVEAEFLRNTLLSSVSHDLRTPLAAITGAASSLAESNLPDAAKKELAEDIVSESERMERLITNLLDMTRLESGRFELKKDWHPLAEIVGAALRHSKKRLLPRPVAVHIPSNLPLIHVDALALDQVLVNLLDNAAAHTPPATPIDITASLDDQNILLAVSDHGPGLPPGEPRQLFQKFFRGKPTHAAVASRPGIGLGLAVCKQIIELHHGTITAANRYEGGAVFHISLPTGGLPPPVPAEETSGQNP